MDTDCFCDKYLHKIHQNHYLGKKISIAFLLADVVGKELLKSSFAVRFP